MTAERGPRTRRRILALIAMLAAVLVAVVFIVRIAVDDPGGSSSPTYDDAPAAARDVAEAKSPARDGASRGKRASPRSARDVAAPAEADGRAIGGKLDPPTEDSTDPVAAAAARAGAAIRPDVAKTPDATSAEASADGGVRRGDIKFDEAIVLVVQLRAAESDAPVTNADVQVLASDGLPRRTRPDFQGRASFSVPSREMVTVEAKAPGRVRRRLILTTKGADQPPVVLALERGVVVQGRVTADGRAVAGATVTAYALDPWLKAPPYDADPTPIETTTSDRRGAYRLDCIPRGVRCALVVATDKHAAEFDEIEPQPDADYVVRRDVTLTRGAVVEGVVRDAKGEPVAGAWVYEFDGSVADLEDERWSWNETKLGDDDKVELALLDDLVESRTEILFRGPRCRTGADGKFRTLVSSRWKNARVIAMHPSAGRSSPSAAVVPGKTQLALLTRGRVRADFDVRSPNDKAAHGATVTPYFPWESWSVSEQSPGIYGVADMDDGPVLVRVAGTVEAPGVYVGARYDVDRLRWRVRLEAGVALKGVVRDDVGAAVVGAVVKAGERSSTTDVHGAFEIVGVRAEVVTVTAAAEGHTEDEEWFDRGDRAAIEITLSRVATVRLRLRPPERAPAPTWRRVWSGPSSDAAVDQFEWSDGVIEIRDRDADDTLVAVFVPGYEIVAREARVKPGESLDLGVVDLVRTRRVPGVVVDEVGNSIPGAEVVVQIRGDAPWRSMPPERSVDADARGQFEIDVAAPDEKCEIVASASGFAPTPQTFDPKSDAPLRVVVGRDRTFRGRAADLSTKRRFLARLVGGADETYALASVAADGTFEADVPLSPRVVEIFDVNRMDLMTHDAFYGTKRRTPERWATVPADLPEGSVFEVAK